MPWQSFRQSTDLSRCCRSFAFFSLLQLAIALSGCASLEYRPPNTEYQTQLGTVAVVALERAPELKFEGFARGKVAGAATGAGNAFAACISGVGSPGCSGSVCGAVLIVMLGICGIAGMVGGVAGAATAPNLDQVLAREALLSRALEIRTIQHAIRDAVLDSALAAGVKLATLPEDVVRNAADKGDYRALARHDVRTVLETTLTEVGTSGAGINDPSTVYMQAHVRLVDTASNAERFATDYLYVGRRLTLAEWSAQQAKPLTNELEKGYRILGQHIYESIFELYPFPDRKPHFAGGFLSVAFGLAPIYPPTRGTLTEDRWIGPKFEWFAVEKLQPQFQWEAFPRPGDIAEAPDEMSKVVGVTYDLIVASEENLAPAEVVYWKTGLISPEHTISISLQPEKRYFWTVRARFNLDGRSRITEWSSTNYFAREKITVPSHFSFRFRTP